MRLAQLARKLGVRPTDIVTFLEGRAIHVENGSNFRLDDETVTLVLKEFGQAAGDDDVTPTNAVADNPERKVPDQPSVPDNTVEPTEPAQAAEQVENVEVIKAPKVELPGLTVLGKIDLPEPKAKTEAEREDIASPASNPEKPRDRTRKHNRDTQRGTRKNPVALQREREAREAERKKRAEAEIEKERRRQKYLSKVKINVPTRPARIYEEEVEELQPETVAEPPTGLWGRFLKWLYRN